MSHRIHFAGINTPGLAEAARGQDVLVSFADVLRRADFWSWLRPMIERGHFRSVILDSGAFTELSERKRGKVFQVDVHAFAAFAAEHQGLFSWVANLDSIEGDVATSNANLEILRAAGVANVVPVYHEGESLEQLAFCLAFARAGRGILAVGGQRPKGKLIPRNVVRFLQGLFAQDLEGVEIHGFGLTRYASPACPFMPAGFEGFPFDSTDSTTWIAEGCAVERAGCYAGATRTEARARALRATVASYGRVAFATGRTGARAEVPAGFDADAAERYGHQARTVARRFVGARQLERRAPPGPEVVAGSPPRCASGVPARRCPTVALLGWTPGAGLALARAGLL